MANGRIALISALVAAGALGAVLVVQPYSVRSPWQAYVRPAKRYLQTALARDSAGLERQSVSVAPVAWALHASRTDPEALAVWAQALRPLQGAQRGDTTDVSFQTSTGSCYLGPMVMSFVGRGENVRVVLASSSCFAEK